MALQGGEMRKLTLTVLLSGSILMLGCGSSEPEKTKDETTRAKPLTKKEKLHNKAKITEAASLVGYDGKKIHKDLDKIIDENAKHQDALKELDDL
jgi:hypothetical protein